MNTKTLKLAKTLPDNIGTRRRSRLVKRLFESAVCLTFALALTVVPALATGGGGAADGGAALDAVNNLSDFIFALIRAIGLILLGYGILQVGLSFQSHDPSQRSNGILTIAGGIIIVFTKEILKLITG